MDRNDPYRGFRFRVEFDQVQHGGFSRVKGLTRETRVEVRREGGVNDFEYRFATLTSYGNLILERGLADDFLWTWQEDVAQGRVQRRTLTVGLHDSLDQEVWRWLIRAAFPVKWSVSDLDAANNQVLVESVEFAHHGFGTG
ncbi:phage tail-like protein [Paraburkholderia sp. BL27I4N3]|uniref:phage tail protein n=1 Tax=Paraburkholderia sp. BL27I4N3 TaxID=1938805 RepID=UPI000E27779E|nr:phage tail protein [Paraburkholderia sp. BL27I4N3]REE18423.1 phage tail-like protein [Paraburkholderia sp. BL27I4N3]